MKNQIKKVSEASANKQKASNSLSQKFQQYIVDKAVNWALQSSNGKSRFSELKWGDDEREILNQIIENPKAANLNLPLKNSKFKIFFKSIMENGLNTDDVKMFYRYRDRLPLRDLQWEFKKEDFSFANKKISSKEVIPAGYYMLEVGIKTKEFNSQIFLDLKTSSTPNSKTQSFELQAKSNQISKRLIYLKVNSKLDAKIEHSVNEADIYHLRLARLTKSFFLSRLLSKLGSKYKSNNPTEIDEEEFETLWNPYSSIFQRNNNPNLIYDFYVKQIEVNQVPVRSEQLENLKRWKKQGQ